MPGDQVPPIRRRFQYFRPDAVLRQEIAGQLANRRLVPRRHESRVHRRDAYQRLLQRDDVVLRGVNLGKQLSELQRSHIRPPPTMV